MEKKAHAILELLISLPIFLLIFFGLYSISLKIDNKLKTTSHNVVLYTSLELSLLKQLNLNTEKYLSGVQVEKKFILILNEENIKILINDVFKKRKLIPNITIKKFTIFVKDENSKFQLTIEYNPTKNEFIIFD